MATEQVSGIVSGTDSNVHDEPHVEGSRLTVRFLREQVEARGLSPASVADRYALSLADVYAALTYYHRNPDEMDAVENRRDARIAEAKDRTTLTPPDEQPWGIACFSTKTSNARPPSAHRRGPRCRIRRIGSDPSERDARRATRSILSRDRPDDRDVR